MLQFQEIAKKNYRIIGNTFFLFNFVVSNYKTYIA